MSKIVNKRRVKMTFNSLHSNDAGALMAASQYPDAVIFRPGIMPLVQMFIYTRNTEKFDSVIAQRKLKESDRVFED